MNLNQIFLKSLQQTYQNNFKTKETEKKIHLSVFIDNCKFSMEEAAAYKNKYAYIPFNYDKKECTSIFINEFPEVNYKLCTIVNRVDMYVNKGISIDMTSIYNK